MPELSVLCRSSNCMVQAAQVGSCISHKEMQVLCNHRAHGGGCQPVVSGSHKSLSMTKIICRDENEAKSLFNFLWKGMSEAQDLDLEFPTWDFEVWILRDGREVLYNKAYACEMEGHSDIYIGEPEDC